VNRTVTQSFKQRKNLVDGNSSGGLAGGPLKRLATGGITVAFFRILGVLLAIAVNAVLARLLSEGDFGRFVLLATMMTTAGYVARMGLERIVVRFTSLALARQDSPLLRRTLNTTVWLYCLTLAMVVVFWWGILSAFGESLLGGRCEASLIVYTSMSIVFGSTLLMIAEVFRGFHRLNWASWFSAEGSGPFVAILMVAQLLILRATGHDITLARSLTVLLVALMVPCILSSLLLVVIARNAFFRLGIGELEAAKTGQKTDDRPIAGAVTVSLFLQIGLPIMLTQLLAGVCVFGDVWIAGAYCGGTELDVIGASKRLTNLLAIPMSIMNATVAATIAGLHSIGKTELLQAVLRKASSIAIIPSLAFGTLLLVFPGPILQIFCGESYSQGGLYVVAMVIGYMFLCFSGSAEMALVMTGKQNVSLAISIIAALALTFLGSWIGARSGPLAIVVVSSTVLAIRSLAVWWAARVCLGIWTHPQTSIFSGFAFSTSLIKGFLR